MGIEIDRHQGARPDEEQIVARRAPRVVRLGQRPRDTYDWHEHSYTKVPYCVRGRIVFITDTGDVDLGPEGPHGAAAAYPLPSYRRRPSAGPWITAQPARSGPRLISQSSVHVPYSACVASMASRITFPRWSCQAVVSSRSSTIRAGSAPAGTAIPRRPTAPGRIR
jgi:hypothetical protein